MKWSKTSWWLLSIGVLAVVFLGLGMAYSRQSREQIHLNQEIAQAQLLWEKSYANLPAEKKRLEDIQSQANSEMEKIKLSLSTANESVAVSEDLFQLARDSNVEIVVVNTSAPNQEQLNGIPYSALSLTVRLRGYEPDILRFISNWTAKNPTGVVKAMTLLEAETRIAANTTGNTTAPGEATEGNTPVAEARILVANLTLAFYSYRGN